MTVKMNTIPKELEKLFLAAKEKENEERAEKKNREVNYEGTKPML